MGRPKKPLPKPSTPQGERVLEALQAGAGTTDPLAVREFAAELAEEMGYSRSIPREWLKMSGGAFRKPGAPETFERRTGYRVQYIYEGREPKRVQRQKDRDRRHGPSERALQMAELISQLSNEAQKQLEPFIKMLVLSERAHFDVVMRRDEPIDVWLQRLKQYFGDEPPNRRSH